MRCQGYAKKKKKEKKKKKKKKKKYKWVRYGSDVCTNNASIHKEIQ
jgi:hypothetical protein